MDSVILFALALVVFSVLTIVFLWWLGREEYVSAKTVHWLQVGFVVIMLGGFATAGLYGAQELFSDFLDGGLL